MYRLFFLVSISISTGTGPKCVPTLSQLPPFDSTKIALLVGPFHITLVDTTGAYARPSETDLVMWVNDSAHRYQYMERRIGFPYGERLFGGAYRERGRSWTNPEDARDGVVYSPGSLYLGTVAVNDGGGVTLSLERLGQAGFSGHWTVDLGIAMIVDSKTGRRLPDPAGYYCAWRVTPFPDSPKPNSPGGA